MNITHRKLTPSDLDYIFAGLPELYEEILALDSDNYIKFPDVDQSEALDDAETSDYKVLEVTDDSDEKVYVIHGFPGDASVWAFVDAELKLIDQTPSTNLMQKFEQWYQTIEDSGDYPDLFHCYIEI